MQPRFIKEVSQHFDRRADRYDNPVTAFIGERELRVIRKFVPPEVCVLDYGCGTGRTTLDLLQRGCQVTAFDISQKMLQIAKDRANALGYQAEFTTGSIDLQGRTWPYVTCIGVLDYYADPQPLLRQLRAALAPQGRLVITYPNALSPLGWLYALGSRLRYPVIPHSPQFARQAAQQAGLEVVALEFAFPAINYLGHTLVVGLKAAS